MSPTVRFVHSAGFRFDSHCWEGPVSWVAMRNKQLWDTFDAILTLCRRENADFLFLTGNLFDQEYVGAETVERLAKSFARLNKTRVFITPGKMDPLVTTTAYRFIEWPENVHIFTGSLNQIEIPTLEVTIYGAGWTTYQQQKNFLKDFCIAEKAKLIQFMLLHAEVESDRNSDGFIPITQEQIAASGLTYLALGHKEKWSGIQKAGDTYWADCGSVEARDFHDYDPHGVLLGETNGNITQVTFLKMGKGSDLKKSEPLKTNNTYISQQGYPALPEVFLDEIQNRIASVDSAVKERYWDLVRKIAMSAIGQGREDKPYQSNIVWPENQEEDFLRRIQNIKEVGDEDLSLAKVRDALRRAKKRVEEQTDAMEQLKIEYEALRRDWEAENRRQEELRILQIEIKKLQNKKKHLTEKIAFTRKNQERLAFLAQNKDYRELRQMQTELPRLQEHCVKTADELAAYARNRQVDWNMIESMREECLEWARLLEEVNNLAEEIRQQDKQINEIEYEIQVSGYQELPENEEERLQGMEAEQKAAEEELNMLSIQPDDLRITEQIYEEENKKLQSYEFLGGMTPVDKRKLTQTVRQLEKWRSSIISGFVDEMLGEKLGLASIEAKLHTRLSWYCQKYGVAHYDEFLQLQQEYHIQQQVVTSLQTKLEHLQKESHLQKSLHTIIDSRSQMLKTAFRIVDAVNLTDWQNGWKNYQQKKSNLTQMQNKLDYKRLQHKLKEEELSAFSNQLRAKVKSKISPEANIDEILEVVMKTACKLRAKEEAEKEFASLKLMYATQLGKRNIDEMAKILEPLADLEREGCLSDEERQTDLTVYLQEYSELDYQLTSAHNIIQHSQTTTHKLDLEKKLEAIKLRWKAYEELQQALNDAQNLIEISQKKWQAKYGKELETQAQIIYENTFSSRDSIVTDTIHLESRQEYFACRVALAELTLLDCPIVPLSLFVGEMKESENFWEEALAYLYELSLSRQVIFDTTDDRLKSIQSRYTLNSTIS